MKIQFGGEELELLPEKAFFWPRKSILGLSDIHLGKAESFQSLGVPLPSTSHHEDLDRWDALMQKHKPKEVYILGDLIHARSSWTKNIVADLSSFLKSYPEVSWNLLLGNHERGSTEFLNQLPLHIYEDEVDVGPFILTHGHHNPRPGQLQIQGHIHPVVKLREGPLRLRLPCFILRSDCLVLPSFGTLTGGHELQFHQKDRVFAVSSESLLEIPR